MKNLAIKAEKLSKKYLIGDKQRYTMLRDLPARAYQKLRRRREDQAPVGELWALDDLSFEIPHGKNVGLIGRNGAGKSTLLKVLSRITVPTKGRATVYGRVGSLLEVGTGFHPELSGRDNVFLNGAILGMGKNKIRQRFDEIVEFADIGDQIDTPVKFYSSGMGLRLAFSVAAHLEPEILLVDEVLAVGDIAFQNKSFNKMNEVVKDGRTVIFVSHNMSTIKALCEEAMFLDNGKLEYFGETDAAISHYLRGSESNEENKAQPEIRPKLPIQITEVEIQNKNGEPISKPAHDEEFFVGIKVSVRKTVRKNVLSLKIHDAELRTIINSFDFEEDDSRLISKESGEYSYRVKIPAPLLSPGQYFVSVLVQRGRKQRITDSLDYVCPFNIFDNGSVISITNAERSGPISMPLEWNMRREDAKR